MWRTVSSTNTIPGLPMWIDTGKGAVRSEGKYFITKLRQLQEKHTIPADVRDRGCSPA